MSKIKSVVKGGAAGAGAGILAEVFFGVANATGAGAYLWVPLCALNGVGLGKYAESVDKKAGTKPLSLVSGLAGLVVSTILHPGFDFGNDVDAAAVSQLEPRDAYVQMVETKPTQLPENITLSR